MKFEAEASGGKCDSYEYKWTGKVKGKGASKTKSFTKVGDYEATVKVKCGKGKDKEEATETASVTVERGKCTTWDVTCYGLECWPYYKRDMNDCMNKYTADSNFDYDACTDAAGKAEKACGDEKCCIKWECK